MERRKRTNRLGEYSPYPKQVDYHNTVCRECLFMAGNQLGKTLAGAAESAMHLQDDTRIGGKVIDLTSRLLCLLDRRVTS